MRIWKHRLDVVKTQVLQLPANSKMLCVQNQGDEPVVWFSFVGSGKLTEPRTFVMMATGAEEVNLEDPVFKYVGTVQLGSFVWHFFVV